jgi:hypothetical protein
MIRTMHYWLAVAQLMVRFDERVPVAHHIRQEVGQLFSVRPLISIAVQDEVARYIGGLNEGEGPRD